MSEATERLIVSIVLAGQFNPSILSPAWFRKTELVSDSEIDSATVTVIHPEVAVFSVGGYAIDVRTNRFSVQVESQPVVRVLDAVETLFGTLLPHSPVQQFGINYNEHFVLDSPARRVALGRALAPLQPWSKWGEQISSLSGETTSGMIGLVMQETYPDGQGNLRVEVRPSSDVEPANCGVFVGINDHNDVAHDPESVPAGDVIEIIKDRFDGSVSRSKTIVDDLYRYACALEIA